MTEPDLKSKLPEKNKCFGTSLKLGSVKQIKIGDASLRKYLQRLGYLGRHDHRFGSCHSRLLRQEMPGFSPI